MSTAGIQAPSVNFEATTTMAIKPVVSVPMALMTAEPCQCFSFNLKWCTTMPACESVKPVNTPKA